MTKLLLSIISICYLVACNSDKKKSILPKKTDSQIQKKDSDSIDFPTININNEQSATIEVPEFNDEEVQKYVTEYNAYVKEYLEAIESKDIVKLNSLGQKAQEWTIKGQTISQKLAYNKEELEKYNNYRKKLSKEIAAALSQQ